MDTQKIGKFIAMKRKEKKLTQAQLGELLGVASKSISKWENGVYMPDLSLLIPISEILEVSLNELLAGESLSKEEAAEQAENSIVMAIDFSNKKVQKLRKKYAFLIALVLILFVIIFLGLQGLFFAKVPYVKGNMAEWENYFLEHSAYEMGMNEESEPIFINPEAALKKARSDYSDAIQFVKETKQLLPFSKYTYKFYLPYLSQTETTDERVLVQLEGLERFLNIYENSFQWQNNEDTEEQNMENIGIALLLIALGIYLFVFLFCTQGFDVIGYFIYKGRTRALISKEEAFTVSKSRRLVEKQVGEKYESILCTQDRSVHFLPFAFYGKTQAILTWNVDETNWRARYPYLRKRGGWAIGEEVELRYSKKRPWKYAFFDSYMWTMFLIKMIFCVGCCLTGFIILVGNI